jgi:hypothetical protein
MKSTAPYMDLQAKNKDEFNRRVLAFSYLIFLSHGRGAVMVSKSALTPMPDGSMAARVEYLPYDSESTTYTPQTKAIFESYNPEDQMVLGTREQKNRVIFAQMTTGNKRLTPKLLGEQWAKGDLAMPWLPGRVLVLDEALPGAPQGRYEFVWRDGDSLHFRQFKKDESGPHASGNPVSVAVGCANAFKPVDGQRSIWA